MSSWKQIIRAANEAWLRANGLPELKASGQAIGSETTLAASLDRTDARPAGPEVGSPLWNRLAIQTDDCGDGSGYCSECGYETERYDEDDEDWVCAECDAALVRGQEEDHRLDDPRHGQARDINRYRYEP